MAISVKDRVMNVEVTPKQKDFLLAEDVDELLYGGAAGGGKSFILLIFALKRRLAYPGTRGIIFRKTYPELERSLISESKKIYYRFGGKYNDQKHAWTFPNGSVQEFGHCQDKDSVYLYQSAEYQDICFDESSHFREEDVRYLTSRCRSSIKGVRPLIRLASNPGNVGHGWHVRRYIKPSQVSPKWKDKETGKVLGFIPAKVDDNPFLMEADPGYKQRLHDLPEKKRLALLEGRWDVFEGQYFIEFDPSKHVLKQPRVPDSYTTKFLCMDWGYAEPSAVYWNEITPLGRLFTYRELYVRGRAPQELALDILQLTSERERRNTIILWSPPEIFGKKIELEGGGQPIAELMQKVLSGVIRMEKANNARVAGWQKMREYMMLAPDDLPWWQISPNCENLIRTLPDQVHDEKNPEDLDTEGEDHGIDAMRMGIVGMKSTPNTILTPHAQLTDYEKIFGKVRPRREAASFLPVGNSRYGY